MTNKAFFVTALFYVLIYRSQFQSFHNGICNAPEIVCTPFHQAHRTLEPRMQAFIFLLFASSCHCVMNSGRLQGAGVKGYIYCRGKPARGVSVKLYEMEPLFDRLMDKGKVNKYGAFKLFGHAREWSDIEPRLYIYHKCGKRFRRRFTIDIPSKYITHFGQQIKFYDVGKVELSKR